MTRCFEDLARFFEISFLFGKNVSLLPINFYRALIFYNFICLVGILILVHGMCIRMCVLSWLADLGNLMSLNADLTVTLSKVKNCL